MRDFLTGPHVALATRDALLARLDAAPVATPAFLTAAEFRTLLAVCARLLPDARIDVAGPVDTRLAAGKSDGWRYDAMPDDGAAIRVGLAGLDGAAVDIAGCAFADAPGAAQDEVLAAVQAGAPPGPAWGLPPRRFFEELLAEAAEVFFAHPWRRRASATPAWRTARAGPASGWTSGMMRHHNR